jgi:hypothetical protein
MSLTATDLCEIRSTIKEELSMQLEPLRGEIEALRNDIKIFMACSLIYSIL